MDEIIIEALVTNNWELLQKIQENNVNLLYYSFSYNGQHTNIIEYIVNNLSKCTFLKKLYDYDTDSKNIVHVVISRLFIEKFSGTIENISEFIELHSKQFDFIPINDIFLYSFDTCYFDFDQLFVEKINFLIKNGLDLNFKGSFGRSVLLTIFRSRKCLNKNDKILFDFLLYVDSINCDLNQLDVFGNNLLYYAFQNRNDIGIIDFLIKKTNFIDFKNWDKTFLSNSVYIDEDFNSRMINIGILSFYPLLKDLHIKDYGRTSIMIPEAYQHIFRNFSLEKVISKNLGICTKKIYKTFIDNIFLINDESGCVINFDLFGLLSILNRIFVVGKTKINIDYICFIIENFRTQESNEYINEKSTSHNDCFSFLNKDDIESLTIVLNTFTEKQVKKIIESSLVDGLLMSELNVLLMMNLSVLNYLKKVSFSDKNTFSKIFFRIKSISSKQQQPCFNLNQTSFMQFDQIGLFPIKKGNYTIVIAEDNHQLIDWGVLAHNCIGDGDYAIKARNGESLLLGAYYLDKLIGTMEIFSKTLIQLKGVYLVKEQEKQIVEMLRDNKIIF